MTASRRRPLVAGNWKMHRTHLQAIHLVQDLSFRLSTKELEAVEVVVVPPFTALRSVQTIVDADGLALRYGAQDLSPHAEGAHTGDVSGPMLAALGCSYVVVGHSERRRDHAEDGALVTAKVVAALAAGLTPIVCVGELEEVRDEGVHVAHCVEQLDDATAGLSAEQVARCVLAYEPVWAIGTGRTAKASDAQEMSAALRARVREQHGDAVADGVRILYGGSVKASNAEELFGCADVDGGLVGGASLDAEEFAAVCRAAL